MAIQLSEAATKQVKELKRAQDLPDHVFLRMGVKGGGCSGLAYELDFDNELRPHDKQFAIDGITVACDAKSYLYLNSTTLDYVQQASRQCHVRQCECEVDLRVRHVLFRRSG
ncbi:MAG TPA: iron-sulfur cluster assembly accessory protein [Methylomirabilota bacterium]|nr:iron-sulfur cluster assembly accessory protein [Methylomirabilota bacterium]